VGNLNVEIKCMAGDAINGNGCNCGEVFVIGNDQFLVVFKADNGGYAA